MRGSNLITAAQLAKGIEGAGWRPVDCRFDLGEPAAGRRAYDEGHIPQAVYAHLDDDLSSPVTRTTGRHPLPEPAQFAARCRAWGISRATRVVAYDDAGGAYAVRLWWLLRDMGHERVFLLDGGLGAWTREGRPLTTDVPHPDAGDIDGRPGHMPRADAQEIAADGLRVLDARDAPRYRGDEEPLDTKAGHIPGALNVPFKQNLSADGTFRAPEELRELYAPILTESTADRAVSYCGSGVTACHTILAIEEAGLGTARLYPGSWSEWIRDKTRRVATGPDP